MVVGIGVLAPIFYTAGIAAVTGLTGRVLERIGQGDKVMFVQMIGYGIAAVYVFNTFFGYLRLVASMFGVSL